MNTTEDTKLPGSSPVRSHDLLAKPLAGQLLWDNQGEIIRGYLRIDPETTMFLLNRQPTGTLILTGCFIPDDQDGKVFKDLDAAKYRAEQYLFEWLETVARRLLANSV